MISYLLVDRILRYPPAKFIRNLFSRWISKKGFFIGSPILGVFKAQLFHGTSSLLFPHVKRICLEEVFLGETLILKNIPLLATRLKTWIFLFLGSSFYNVLTLYSYFKVTQIDHLDLKKFLMERKGMVERNSTLAPKFYQNPISFNWARSWGYFSSRSSVKILLGGAETC